MTSSESVRLTATVVVRTQYFKIGDTVFLEEDPCARGPSRYIGRLGDRHERLSREQLDDITPADDE